MPSPLRIAIVEPDLGDTLTVLAEQARDAGLELVNCEGELDLAGYQAVVTARRPLPADALRHGAPELRHVQILGRHFDHVDWRAARTLGLSIGTQPRKSAWTVAELALTFVLALSKDLLRADRAVRTGAYRELGLEPMLTDQRSHAFQWMRLPVREVEGATVGIVGMGEIGAELALRLRPLGVTTRYFKRRRLSPEAEAGFGATYAPLPDLLAMSDFVIVAVPQTSETEGLIGAEALSWMRRDAYLINVARGAIVDEHALVDALRGGRIRGAALDVFAYEPLPAGHPLTTLDNVLLTPHIGGGTGTTRAAEWWGAVERAVETLRTGTVRFPLVLAP